MSAHSDEAKQATRLCNSFSTQQVDLPAQGRAEVVDANFGRVIAHWEKFYGDKAAKGENWTAAQVRQDIGYLRVQRELSAERYAKAVR